MKPNQPAPADHRNVVHARVRGEWHVFTWADGESADAVRAIRDAKWYGLTPGLKINLVDRLVRTLKEGRG